MAKKEKTDIKEIITTINKHFGKDLLRSAAQMPPVRKIRTGELALDYVLDGGFPLNRIVEFLGDAHSGKTRDALVVLSAFQKLCANCYTQNLTCEWTIKDGVPQPKKAKCSCKKPKPTISYIIDYEKTFDLHYAKQYFDIDLNGVLFAVPERPSELVDTVDFLLRQPDTGLVIVDSIGLISSDSEIDRSQAEIKMNEGARFMNMAIRKWQAALNANFNATNGQSVTSLLLINRTYETLSLYSTEVAQGGKGLKHAKSISITRRIVDKVRVNGNITAVHRELKNLKNKAGMPYRVWRDILYVDGAKPETYMKTNIAGQYVDFAIYFGLIKQKGAWYEYKDHKWQGRAKIEEEIMKTPLVEEVNMLIYGEV